MSDDDFGFSERCKGITKAGTRCKITENSPYPTARTISKHGYCTQHLNQGGVAPASSTNKRKREEPQPPIVVPQHSLVVAATSGSADDIKKELDFMQNDIKTLNLPAEVGVALLASVREGHPEVVAELLCIGADLKALPGVPEQTAESALQDVQRLLSSRAPRADVRSALGRRRRLECVKALLAAATPLPSLPNISSEPQVREIEPLTVEELKAVLRKHGARLSGRKAELIQRIKDGKYMEIEREEELRKHHQLLQEANGRRVDIEAQVARRTSSLRSILRDNVPRVPTEAEVDALAYPNAKVLKARSSAVPGACAECNGWLGRQNGRPPSCSAANCPGSKSTSTGYSGVPFRSVPTPIRAQPGFMREMSPPRKKQDTRPFQPPPSSLYARLDCGKCVNCRDNTAAKACSVNMCGKCCKAPNCTRHR
eukprot:gnl/TRDRNA2_/TRDRNA2_172175_c0_seq3.p1 gnl/TRDRNA2_/TRDRNA2_172175_c0~~gnl/TRDRNA2_/TRDRNA2_172175_c0_seq3.p1  ORF type:complete len:484 (-),score=69.53 gnl/TRDRNA2_/TRDRNA2_172175_c0_seq3:288-1568(-)